MTQLWVGGSPGEVPWGVLYTEVSLWWYLPGHLVWSHLCVCVCGCVGVCLCAHLTYNNICMHTIYMYACMCISGAMHVCCLQVFCCVCSTSSTTVMWWRRRCTTAGRKTSLRTSPARRRHSSRLGRGEVASYSTSLYFHSLFCSEGEDSLFPPPNGSQNGNRDRVRD